MIKKVKVCKICSGVNIEYDNYLERYFCVGCGSYDILEVEEDDEFKKQGLI